MLALKPHRTKSRRNWPRHHYKREKTTKNPLNKSKAFLAAGNPNCWRHTCNFTHLKSTKTHSGTKWNLSPCPQRLFMVWSSPFHESRQPHSEPLVEVILQHSGSDLPTCKKAVSFNPEQSPEPADQTATQAHMVAQRMPGCTRRTAYSKRTSLKDL